MDLNQPFDLAAIVQSIGVPSERIETPTRIPPPKPKPSTTPAPPSQTSSSTAPSDDEAMPVASPVLT